MKNVITGYRAGRVQGREMKEQEFKVFQQIQEDVGCFKRLELWSRHEGPLIPKWRRLLESEPARFVDGGERLRTDSLRTFRRDQVFIPDIPGFFDPNKLTLRNALDGARRGIRRTLIECLDITEREGYGGLLRKYPCHPTGQPRMFSYRGYQYTVRWLKHIYYLGLLKKHLGHQLGGQRVVLDLGSSYGIFPYLMKHEFPGVRVLLVDFPEQLILARYFLSSCFPKARIAGIRELERHATVTREVVEQYEFMLIPVQRFAQLAAGCVDLFTNFASLGGDVTLIIHCLHGVACI